MNAADLPGNETRRLASLYEYDILDSQQEGVFDELADLAASICGAPIALISLVDESRQWFKARVGLEAKETARNVSFCAHAILQPGLFLVPDTLEDARFADNPLVTGAPNIRFYAGAPLFTEDGLGLGTLCVIDRVPRDLTPEQQRALMVLRTHVLKLLDLRRTTRELNAANRDLAAFSFAVSHDLRAPLRTIMGYVSVLQGEHIASLNADGAQMLMEISKSSHRMNSLIYDLINLARVASQPPQYQNVDLSELARSVAFELAKAEPTRQVDVHIQPGISVLGDPGLLRAVMENLLGNAWKFTSKCAKPRIEFCKEAVNSAHEFVVRDNGAGFEMAYAGKLFQPFKRLHASSEFPGTGIGLATVKRIVERHGGAIRAESVVNQGTAIRFTLHGPQGGKG